MLFVCIFITEGDTNKIFFLFKTCKLRTNDFCELKQYFFIVTAVL